jgi:undecaprenyl-diphosphatase
LAIAALLFVFGFVALDVATRKPSGFDHCVTLALRKSAKEPVPIGPPWLQEAARDVTSLGSIIVLLIITFAVAGYLFLARKPGVAWLMLIAVFGGLALNNFLKFVFARPRPDVVSHAARFHNELPKWACDIVCNHLSDDRRPSGASLSFPDIGPLFHVRRGASNGAHRPEPNLSWCAFPTDILGGWCIGAAWAIACWVLMAWLQQGGQVEQPGPV